MAEVERGVQKLELTGKRTVQLRAGSEINLASAGKQNKRTSFRQSLAVCTERAQVRKSVHMMDTTNRNGSDRSGSDGKRQHAGNQNQISSFRQNKNRNNYFMLLTFAPFYTSDSNKLILRIR